MRVVDSGPQHRHVLLGIVADQERDALLRQRQRARQGEQERR